MKRKDIIDAIKDLKRERLPGWYVHAARLFKMLEKMDDPYADLVHEGNEQSGRKCRNVSPPDMEDLTEDSKP